MESFQCILCNISLDNLKGYVAHLKSHYRCSYEGRISCLKCSKAFNNILKLAKHIRRSHFERRHVCQECGKAFISHHKLKTHMLCHSEFAEFLCSLCGRNYKRRDKLRDHLKRMHTRNREDKSCAPPLRVQRKKRFRFPKMSLEEIAKFPYQCTICSIGFNRRGILVNHMTRIHPDVPLKTVPQLTAPVLLQQRVFKCQYCDKVYMSNGKRKSHILNTHPGAEISSSSSNTKKMNCIEVKPRSCPWCSRQYLTNAKLLQHQRKDHRLHKTASHSSPEATVLSLSDY